MSRQSLDSAQNSSANHGQIKSNYLLKGLVLGLAPAGHPCSSRKHTDLPNPHLVSFPSGSLLLNPMQLVMKDVAYCHQAGALGRKLIF